MKSSERIVRVDEGDLVSAEDFKKAFRSHPGGVAVVTADIGDGPVGLTLTSVTSVSVDPPSLIFSVSDASSSTPTVLRAKTVVVHFIGERQLDVARLCATSGIDRFADTSTWRRLPTGEPYFHSVDTILRGRIINKLRIGNATVVAVQILPISSDAETHPIDAEASRPVVYHDRKWHVLTPESEL